ncbi:MAG: endonuclease domain-containing protein [Hyphomonadaceae bacterium]
MSRRLPNPDVHARFKSERANAFARVLRKDMTEAERVLWRGLRALRQEGSHWRKQTTIGPFIADFCCHSAKLIVEIDGAVHDSAEAEALDEERQAWLEARGYRVLRFGNGEVLRDVSAVLQRICDAGALTPTPGPSPQGGGE